MAMIAMARMARRVPQPSGSINSNQSVWWMQKVQTPCLMTPVMKRISNHPVPTTPATMAVNSKQRVARIILLKTWWTTHQHHQSANVRVTSPRGVNKTPRTKSLPSRSPPSPILHVAIPTRLPFGPAGGLACRYKSSGLHQNHPRRPQECRHLRQHLALQHPLHPPHPRSTCISTASEISETSVLGAKSRSRWWMGVEIPLAKTRLLHWSRHQSWEPGNSVLIE